MRRAAVLFFVLVLGRVTLFAQFDTLWFEGFDNADGLGTLWFIDTSKSDLSGTGGHFEVRDGVFSANYLDSVAIWKTKNFFIGDKSSIGIKIKINSPQTEPEDSVQIFYSVDNTDSILLTNGERNGPIIPAEDVYTCYGEGIAGDSIKLIVRTINDDSDDTLSFDNILIFSNEPLQISGEDTVCVGSEGEPYTIEELNGHSYWWDIDIGTGIIQGGDNTNDTVLIDWSSTIDTGLLIVYDTTSNFSCTFSDTLSIEVNDFEPPTLTKLPDDTLYITDSCWLIMPDYVALANVGDNCGSLFDTIQDPSPGGYLDPLKYKHDTTIQVIITLIDKQSNETIDTIDVLILDTIVPEISYLGEDTVELSTQSGSCTSDPTDIDGVFIDDCSDFDTTYTMSGATSGSGSGFITNQQFNIGITYIKYIFTDIAGNKDSISIAVEVIDDVFPIITCPSDTTVRNDDPGCSAIVNNIALRQVSDNCTDSASLTIKYVLSSNINDTLDGYASGETFNIDTTSVTYLVTDATGNTAIDSFLVIVNDSTPPNFTPDTDIYESNGIDSCSATITIPSSTATDNCDGPGVTIIKTRDDGLLLTDPYPVGITKITWTATDTSRNDSIAEQIVVVSDTSKPTINCPGDYNNIAAEDKKCEAKVYIITPGTADNCGVDSIWNNYTNTSDTAITFSVGAHELVWYIVDIHGNTDSCSMNVVVSDTQKPTFTPPTDTTINYGTSTDSTDLGSPTDLNDNCSDAVDLIISHTDTIILGTCPAIDTLKRTWHVIDEYANDSTWIQNIIRIDTSAPNLNIQDTITITLPESTGVDTISYLDIDIGTTDSTGFTMWLSDSTFDCSYIGDTTIIFYAQDQCGNIDSAEVTVIVKYETLPATNIFPQSDTICSGNTTSISLDGNVPMDFTWSAIAIGVNGSFAGADSIGGNISQVLTNPTDSVGTVDYIITPIIYDKCTLSELNDTVLMLVNPVPKIAPLVKIDTICNGNFANIKLETPTNPTDSIRFDYIINDPDNSIDGGSNGTRIEPNDSIYQKLTNTSNDIKFVDYIITPYLLDNTGGEVCKSADNNDTVRIYINPTPDLDVELITPDTLCNLNNIQINISSVNLNIGGDAYYTLDVDTFPGTLDGITPDGDYNLALNSVINDTPENLTDSVQIITYKFTPWFDSSDSEAGSCIGVEDTSITIYVNPTPEISVSVTDTVICNNGTVSFIIDSLVQSSGAVRYHLDVNYLTGVTGDLANGDFNIQNLTDNINNATKQVQPVTYNFKAFIEDARPGDDCDNGKDTTITIYVNPTPEISVSVTDTIICNDGTVSFIIDSLVQSSGAVRYHLDVNYPVDVSGNLVNGDFNIQNLTDDINNATKQVQPVTYNFKAFIEDARPGDDCDNGRDTTITIYMNPTPEISVSVTDTVICNDGTVSFTIDSLVQSSGAVRYHLDVNYPADVSGNLVNGDFNIQNITDDINNATKQVQPVTYNFKAFIEDARPGDDCDNGKDTTITIYVNPTPEISVSVTDTVICNDGTVSFTIDSLVQSSGAVRYHLDVNYPADVSGNLVNGDFNIQNLTDDINNATNQVQLVTYNFKAFIEDARPGDDCDNGRDTTITIYVNPTPEISVSVTDTVICNNGTVSFTIDSLMQSSGTVMYHLTVNYPTGVTGDLANGDLNIQNLTGEINNTTDQVQPVTYNFKAFIEDARPGDDCDNGRDTTITIYVNPTPEISVSVTDTVICNDGTIDFAIDSLMQSTGMVRYHLTVNYPTGVTGDLANGDLNIQNITDEINNATAQVQPVTYNFKAFIEDAKPGDDCDNGRDTTITIYVNPTPEIKVSVHDTIYCDLDDVEFIVNSKNGKVEGDKIFTLETNYLTVPVTGIQGNGDYILNTNDSLIFNNQLNNLTDSFQIIEYTFKARIKNPRTGLTYCDNGMDTTIRIYVNPTPRIQINNIQPDTILCDSSALQIGIISMNGKILGDKYYSLTTDYINGAVEGTRTEDDYNESGFSFTDNLVNHTDSFQVIKYHFKAKFLNTGSTSNLCNNGLDTTITIYLNPTPRISVAVNDTIYCNESPVEFIVNSPTTNILGDLKFDTEAVASGISGSSDGTMDRSLINFIDVLENNDTILHYIDYTLTPKINNISSSSSTTCGNGIPASIRVYITPTFQAISKVDTFIGGWNISCNGNNNGRATSILHGGYTSVPGYIADSIKYEWHYVEGNINYSTQEISDLTAGTYHLTVTDKILSCEDTFNIELTEPDSLKADIHITVDLACVGDENGSMEAIIKGGTESYDVTWVRKGTNPYPQPPDSVSIDSLITGRYDLFVEDANGCTVSNTTELQEGVSVQVKTPELNVLEGETDPDLNGYHIACYGGVVDSIQFSGKGDYSYNFIFPNRTEKIFEPEDLSFYVKNLPAGHYDLITTDVNNCKDTSSFELLQPDSIKIGNIEISSYDSLFNISCYGKNDGYIHLDSITGGHFNLVNPYEFNWETSDGGGIVQNQQYQDVLEAGTYYVTVYDTYNCFAKDTILLYQPDEFIVDAEIKRYSGGFNISCYGKADGEITVKVEGGYIPSGAYKYSWSNGVNDSIITGLTAKNYSLTVEDDIECTTKKSYNLVQPEEMDINYILGENSGYNISCNSGKDGKITLIPSGGDNTTYLYQWKALNGEGIAETIKDQTGLTAGSYRVIVSDSNFCIDSTTIELIEPEELKILSIEKQDVSCDGKIKGFAEVMETGGAGSNTYLWSNGETTKRIENLNALFFTVTITDINHCQTVGSVQVEKTDSLEIELIPVEQYSGKVISCYGSNDGEIKTHVMYGKPPYTYSWSTGSTDSIITNLNKGRYDVTITDILECEGTQTIFIDQPNPIDVEIAVTNATCYNFSNGYVSLNTFDGTGPYSFNWFDKEINTIPNYSGLKAGNYSVTIFDANNCEKDTLFEINHPTPLSVDYEIEKPFCPDMKDGSITATAKGGIPVYNYSWNTGINSDFVDQLNEDDYILSITDANLCELIDTVSLKSDTRDCLDIPTAFTPNHDGYNDTWEIVVSSDKYPQLPKVGDIYPDVTVEIYNRWGELIFISENGYENEWNGKNMKTGKDLPIDSYHYVIDFGDGRVRTGNVTIIR